MSLHNSLYRDLDEKDYNRVPLQVLALERGETPEATRAFAKRGSNLAFMLDSNTVAVSPATREGDRKFFVFRDDEDVRSTWPNYFVDFGRLSRMEAAGQLGTGARREGNWILLDHHAKQAFGITASNFTSWPDRSARPVRIKVPKVKGPRTKTVKTETPAPDPDRYTVYSEKTGLPIAQGGTY